MHVVEGAGAGSLGRVKPVGEPEAGRVRLLLEGLDVGLHRGPEAVHRVCMSVSCGADGVQERGEVGGHRGVDDLVHVGEVVVDGALGQRAGIGHGAGCARLEPVPGEDLPGRFDDLRPLGKVLGGR